MSKQITLTQGKVAIVDDGDFEFLNQWKWFYHQGYAVRNIGKKYLHMHRLLANTPNGKETDHKDGNTLNNTRRNLRICSTRQNSMNRISRKNSSSKFKGVTWHCGDRKWQAQITLKSKLLYLGSFITEKAAALAYNIAAKKYFGRFAKLNVI